MALLLQRESSYFAVWIEESELLLLEEARERLTAGHNSQHT